jgi:SP family facilitated glucose transporter-like MFS transporter 8
MAWHLSQPTVFKPLIILSILFILQQFTGIYTFQFHAINMLKVLYTNNIISILFCIIIYTFFFFFCIYIYILKEVVKGVNLKFATFLFGLLRFILSFVATGMLHTYGRRPLCMISGIIMAITLLISGLCFHLKAIGNNDILLIVYLMKYFLYYV